MLELMAIVKEEEPPYPPGTPFKGVVSPAAFISGPALASQIGLTTGIAHNNEEGWLHFIEDNGFDIYIAKKTFRYNLSLTQIQAATNNGTKEIELLGDTFVIRGITGLNDVTGTMNDSNGGGEWNRYIYNVYDGPARSQMPVGTPVWGYYDELALGLSPTKGLQTKGQMTLCHDRLTASPSQRVCRGFSNSANPDIFGVWYQDGDTYHDMHGWRPVLVRKSTIPPPVYRGLVAQADFITFDALSTAMGVTLGTVINNSVEWMRFVENDGKELYIPRKGIRNGISWEQLNGLNLVFGTRTIVVGGRTFKVRLIKAAVTDPAAAGQGLTGREWKRYIVGMSNGLFASQTETWLGVNDAGFQMTLSQEASTTEASAHCAAGYPSINDLWYQQVNVAHPYYVWRPILELVP